MSFQVLLITSAECTNCFWHFFPKLFSPGLFAEAMKLFLMAIIYGCFCCVTANRCRPYLVTPVEDYNNYINAVFLNVSFSRAPAYRFLALKSFWSCCRYVIEWVFLLSFSYIVSLSLWRSHSRVIGGKMPSSLLRCPCQTPLSISGEWFMTRIPTALLCWMKSRRQMKYDFYSFSK